jgi:hypothetical protein
MKLKDLAAKPKLVKVVLDDAKIIELYDEPVEFWMWDRQDLMVYIKLSALSQDRTQLMDLIRELILDETGKPMLEPNEIVPIEILVPLATSVVNHLGNLKSQTTVS